MAQSILAHYDGHVLVPDEPVALSPGQQVRLLVQTTPHSTRGRLNDPNLTIEQRREYLREMFAGAVSGANIPDEALRRENMYGDDGR